jgi:hypothetical protein
MRRAHPPSILVGLRVLARRVLEAFRWRVAVARARQARPRAATPPGVSP